jgi:adenosyl cobinamide kinase/adenosyl cobinamide phosphate guanylyltransferase
MVYVNAHTPNYKQIAQKLKDSLKAFNLQNEVVEFESRGSWVQNCLYKAEFIQEMQAKHGKVVWLDADCQVLQEPVLFDCITEDIGYHLFKNKEVLSGTLFFNDTQNAKDLLTAWVNKNNKHSSTWDQKNLATVLKEVEHNACYLPPEYCFIFDLSRKYYGSINPVIEHYQASRQKR